MAEGSVLAARVRTGLASMNSIPAPEQKSLRQFGLITGTAVALMFGLVLPWLGGWVLPLWPWIIAAMLVGLALLVPRGLKPVHVVWMRVGHIVNWVVGVTALAVVYCVVVVPTGIVLRTLMKGPMRDRIEPAARSYRVPSPVSDRKRLERPF